MGDRPDLRVGHGELGELFDAWLWRTDPSLVVRALVVDGPLTDVDAVS